MACNVTLNGISKDCSGSVGGIRTAWIATYGEVTPTVTADLISKVEVGNGGTGFRKFDFRKNTGNFSTTINNDDASGTTYYTTEIALQFTRQETEKRIEIAALAVGDVVVVIKDANNKFWYFGFDEPVTLSAGTAETGTAKADFNGYNITLSDESTVMPYEIDATFAKTMFS